MLRSATRVLRAVHFNRLQTTRAFRATTASRSKTPPSTEVPSTDVTDVEDDHDDEQNQLEGKRTRDNLHATFQSRCADVVRYDYFAQRADLEAETEAAALFRGLSETARQHALGFMELSEEYGDADFGGTVQNLETAARDERAFSDGALKEHAVEAGREDLPHIEEFFEDVAEAADKASTRFELASFMTDSEGVDSEDVEDTEDSNDRAKH